MLNAEAPLVASGLLVIRFVQARDIRRVDRQNTGGAGCQREPGIVKLHRSRCIDLQAEGNVGSGVVHVVALNALVHDAKAATNDALPVAAEVVGETDTRTEVSPVVVHQALWNTVLLGNSNTVEVERNASENWVGAGAEAGAGRTDGAIGIENGGIGWVVEAGVE